MSRFWRSDKHFLQHQRGLALNLPEKSTCIVSGWNGGWAHMVAAHRRYTEPTSPKQVVINGENGGERRRNERYAGRMCFRGIDEWRGNIA